MNVISTETGEVVTAYAKVLMTHRQSGRVDISYLIKQRDPGHAAGLDGLSQFYNCEVLYCRFDTHLRGRISRDYGWVDQPTYVEEPVTNEHAVSFLLKKDE